MAGYQNLRTSPAGLWSGIARRAKRPSRASPTDLCRGGVSKPANITRRLVVPAGLWARIARRPQERGPKPLPVVAQLAPVPRFAMKSPSQCGTGRG